jgi:HEAT repeat protein
VAKEARVVALKRRDLATEAELLAQLLSVPEVGLGTAGNAVARAYRSIYAERASLGADPGVTDLSPLYIVLPAIRQLPYKSGPVSQLTTQQGQTLDLLAKKLHAFVDQAAPQDRNGKRHMASELRVRITNELRERRPEWLRAEAMPAMLQLLMHEDPPLRGLLIEFLAQIPGKAATEALAARAVFDLDADNRQAAIDALRSRPADEFRAALMKAMQYPWPPAADHAAEALVALSDRGAVPELVAALRTPNPDLARQQKDGRWAVQELVRTRHLANCMLCHPPAITGTESVLGVDPIHDFPTGEGLAVSTSGTTGGTTPRRGSYGRPAAPALQTQSAPAGPVENPGDKPLLIRADITFLRQDFSAQQAIAVTPGAPPERFRFDYILRNRPATKVERDRAHATSAEDGNYPQREAVLFALRELTGRDAGTSTAAWQDVFPNAEDEAEAARLCRQLLGAGSGQQQALLERLKDAKGLANTLAIARAIPSLKGATQQKAREYLAERLGRMTPKTLRDKFADDEPEVRRAAIAACVRTGKKGLVGELIKLLDDGHPAISQAAENGLKELTGRTFATPAEWRDWWQNEGRSQVARPD